MEKQAKEKLIRSEFLEKYLFRKFEFQERSNFILATYFLINNIQKELKIIIERKYANAFLNKQLDFKPLISFSRISWYCFHKRFFMLTEFTTNCTMIM